MSVSTFIVIALVEDRGWTLIAAAGTAALLQFSGAIGRVAWGVVSDRWIAKLVGKMAAKLENAQGDVGYSGEIPVPLEPYRAGSDGLPSKLLP